MAVMLSQEEANRIAGAHFGQIATVIDGAFDDYTRALNGISSIGIRTDFKSRTAANFVHDLIASHARLAFFDDSEVKVGEFNGIFGLVIKGKIFVRFKKLNSDMKTANVPTEQAEQFNKQQLELPGLGRLTLLTAGYVLDRTGTAIRNIYLTCRRGNEIIWHRDLRGESQSGSMFAPQVGPINPVGTPPTVRLKEQKDDISQTGS
jgi:hypothetical protein